MNLFEQAFGTATANSITQRPISHAQRWLVIDADAVLHVTLAARFKSLNRFNEAFKNAFGCSPRNSAGDIAEGTTVKARTDGEPASR